MKKISIVLLIVGLCLTVFSLVTVFTKEKVVDIGKLEITRDKPHRLNVSPYIGVAVMVVGGLVLLISYKNKN